jgi:hypothetical protein
MMTAEKKSPGGGRGDREKEKFTIPVRSLAGFPANDKYAKIFQQFLSEAGSTEFGVVSLHFHLERGKLVRYKICAEKSFLPPAALVGGEK